MKIYNDGVPEEIFLFMQKNKYEPYNKLAFTSVTSLIKPTKFFWLEKRHKDEIKAPATSLLASSFGTMFHICMEMLYKDNMNCLIEERMYKPISTMYGVYIITGKPDKFQINEGIITDYKETSVYAILNSSKEDEWEKQENMYAYMIRTGFVIEKGMKELKKPLDLPLLESIQTFGTKVNKLKVLFRAKDWRSWEVERKKNYPELTDTITLRLMSEKEQEIMIQKLLEEKLQYANTPDDDIPACSQKERWQDYTKYAVYKKGNDRASRVLSSKKAAKNYIRKLENSSEDMYIEPRIGEPKRCKKYCYYNDYCDWYQKFLAKNSGV